MTEVIIWDPLERFLWGIAFTLFLIVGLLYWKKAREREDINDRRFLYAFTGLNFGIAFFILFHYIKELIVPGDFESNVYMGTYSVYDLAFDILFKLTWLSFYIGILGLILVFEVNYKQTKFIFTISGIIIMIIFIFTPYHLIISLYVDFIIYSYFAILCVGIMIIFMLWSDWDFKVLASYILLGLNFIGHGAINTNPEVKELNALPIFMPPLFLCIGAVLMSVPLLITPKDFEKTMTNWLIVNLGIIISHLLLIYFYIVAGYTFKYIIGNISFSCIYLYLEYVNFKSVRTYRSQGKTGGGVDTSPNVLAMFAKPQKLTEEEVSVSKEKKICLICKGKVGGLLFMCNGCGAFYCHKCYSALTNLENACWACDSALDESKPVKLLEREEEKEEVMVEGDIHKEGMKKKDIKAPKNR